MMINYNARVLHIMFVIILVPWLLQSIFPLFVAWKQTGSVATDSL